MPNDQNVTEIATFRLSNARFETKGARTVRIEDFVWDYLGKWACDVVDRGRNMLTEQQMDHLVGDIFKAIYGDDYLAHKVMGYSHEPVDELNEPVVPYLRISGQLERYTCDREVIVIAEPPSLR